MLIKVHSLDELAGVTETLIRYFDLGFRIVLLKGEMGAGKTTFVKALCQECGVMTPVSSPTFSLIQEYESPSRGTIYHMDFYRIEDAKDLERIGLSEYLDSGNICLIEWPEIAASYFVPPYIEVEITPDRGNIRNFKISTHDEVDA